MLQMDCLGTVDMNHAVPDARTSCERAHHDMAKKNTRCAHNVILCCEIVCGVYCKVQPFVVYFRDHVVCSSHDG